MINYKFVLFLFTLKYLITDSGLSLHIKIALLNEIIPIQVLGLAGSTKKMRLVRVPPILKKALKINLQRRRTQKMVAKQQILVGHLILITFFIRTLQLLVMPYLIIQRAYLTESKVKIKKLSTLPSQITVESQEEI